MMSIRQIAAIKFLICIIIFGLVSLPENVIADTVGWELRKDADNIQVSTRKVKGSRYKAVKAVAIAEDIRLSSLVALIMDAEACSDWADKCGESYVYEQLSETEFYIYNNNDMPFPVKDRDALTHVRWSQNPQTLEVLMVSVATVGIMPKKKGRLRLTEAETSWRFKPLPDGNIEVVNEAHINPGSSVPGWLTNMLLVDTPFETMKSFLSEAKKSKYKQAKISFVMDQ